MMRRIITRRQVVTALLGWGALGSADAVRAQNGGPRLQTLRSPDGKIQVAVEASEAGLRYSVARDGRTILAPSLLGITVDGQNLGQNPALGKPTTREIKERYPVFGGHSRATNQCRETIIPLVGGAAKTPWMLEVRVFDDGVAYRYRVPGTGDRKITGEASQWKLPPGCPLWFQSWENRSYEATFVQDKTDTLKPGNTPAAPVTIKLPGEAGYAMLTEANLVGYSDMTFEIPEAGTLHAIFPNDKNGWTATGEIVSPWRVTLIARDLNALVNSDLLTNLCPPPSAELATAKWIQPGRSVWHWMVTGSPRLEEQRQWVDWTKQLGYEYYLIDDGWVRWRAEGKDQWALLKETVDYARTQGVRIWAWVNSAEVRQQSPRLTYLQKARDAGVVGLKIDFPNEANAETIQWYDDTLRDLAKYQLMVDFHGAVKPSGRSRTWPHELTREAISGREQGKLPAVHDTSLPFTRYVQGPADYTPTELRPDKLGGSTWARELAMAVVYTSPFLCFCGSPESYLQNPAREVIKALPAVWDETRVLPGSEIGSVAAFARRKGNSWFIGVVNGADRHDFTVELGFLGGGTYHIDRFANALEEKAAWDPSEGRVTRRDTLRFTLIPDGGFVARLEPSKE